MPGGRAGLGRRFIKFDKSRSFQPFLLHCFSKNKRRQGFRAVGTSEHVSDALNKPGGLTAILKAMTEPERCLDESLHGLNWGRDQVCHRTAVKLSFARMQGPQNRERLPVRKRDARIRCLPRSSVVRVALR